MGVIKIVLKNKNSKVFKFDVGDIWDGDEQIIEWIMRQLNVGVDSDLEGCKIKKKTYFVVNCIQ